MKYLLVTHFLLLTGFVFSQNPKFIRPVLPVQIEKGQIQYNADSVTGDRVPDFSYCGYKASEEKIPFIPAKIIVPLIIGDATATIQTAINEIANLPLQSNGFRGAVILSKGQYNIGGQLRITKSGVVLRGQGANGETILLGKGMDRDGIIRIFGKDDRVFKQEIKIENKYVPVNASSFLVNTSGFKIGDRITIHRPSTKEWIESLGTESFGGGISALGWHPGEADVFFDRKVIDIKNNKISIDAPLTVSVDEKFGGGYITSYSWDGVINNVGIENITLVSDYDKKNPKDDYHRWMAITLDNIEDAWVRQVSFAHFAGSAVYILSNARRVTVEDCISENPVSEIGGQRRYTFFTRGQQTLIQRCYAENGYHDFSVGHCAAGPNAFVQCTSVRPYNFSGAIDKWATGILFDIVTVDGNAIRLGNRGQDGQGAGWSAANSFLWNCSAAMIECDKPPTAQNWSYGSWGQFSGKGFWAESNNALSPRSFYYTQLSNRLSKKVDELASILDIETEASSSPSVVVAQELTKEASKPKKQIIDWIKESAIRNPISVSTAGAKTIKPFAIKDFALKQTKTEIKNGWLINDGAVVTGRQQEVPWWTGGVEAKDLEAAKQKLSLTRFVPGRVGAGLTDDLEVVIDSMKAKNIVALEQHYPLWYERRRDDHERIRRMNSEVWAPFYELPFARSGKDSAWDCLSKYDLTKYNPWYWSRLQQFANLASANGMILLHENYFQHNIIEAGAHYADFPWRTANNINKTGFIEPVNYAGDKRIFYAEQFYDVSNPERRKLHIQYIEQCLNNFRNNDNVIQLTSEEYTGPLHFVQFWLESIKNWEQKNKKQIIGLSATKDVQDAILADSKYNSIVDLIEIKYWHYQADGSVYAPEGGKNLAPRQWSRLLKPKPTSFDQVYKAVKEYRDKYPSKAVMYSGDSYDKFGWASFMAGGSLAVLPKNVDKGFLKAASEMKPANGFGKYALAGKEGFIVYATSHNTTIDLNNYKGNFIIKFLNAETGSLIGDQLAVQGSKQLNIVKLADADIIWLIKR